MTVVATMSSKKKREASMDSDPLVSLENITHVGRPLDSYFSR